ncbi:uncharacterized protein LOC120175520 [Hibiscus syriacus]|uniref:uncharacterized protein LOC120175520 n=1 Tax=Hibiscus syriacus TaxID=106335 RepID=UPI001923E4F2|nr:uncharacterized protein LOC120175520 [Hibiscus syriacus]
MRTDYLQFSADSNAIKDIWDDIRPKSQKVPWHNLLWFPLHIPKHCLIVWMAIQDRLPTRDRLQNMGINIAALCVNCSNYPETRNHLFADCSLADRLWNIILNVNGMNASHLSWNEMVYRAITSWKWKSQITSIVKIAWSAFIYSIWQERNQRIFQARSRSAEQLFTEIYEAVRLSLRGKTINRIDSTNLSLCNAWGL